MRKKLTITIDQEVYKALYAVIGKRHISHFLEEVARPLIMRKYLEAEYLEMAKNKEEQKEALEWANGTIKDFSDEDEAW